MIRPAPGLEAMLNAVPYRFLYRLVALVDGEGWRCRPLFVTAPDRDVVVRASDRLTLLHSSPR
jgi:hypothetical protein